MVLEAIAEQIVGVGVDGAEVLTLQ